MESGLSLRQPARALSLTAWLILSALGAATPVVAQDSGLLILRAADTAWVRREADARRYAAVSLDGEAFDRLPSTEVTLAVRPGLHTVVVTKPGYAPFSDTVRVGAGERVLVTVRLEPDRIAIAPAGAWVRLRAAGARTEGRIAAASADTLFLTAQPPFRLAVVDSLWIRRSSWRRGGTIGAIMGGVAVGALGYVATLLGSSEPGAGAPPSAGVTIVGAAIVGAAGGFLLGAVIGAAMPPHWDRRYPR